MAAARLLRTTARRTLSAAAVVSFPELRLFSSPFAGVLFFERSANIPRPEEFRRLFSSSSASAAAVNFPQIASSATIASPSPATSPSSSSSSAACSSGESTLYRELLAGENGGAAAAKRPRADWEQLEAVFRHFANSGWASDQALAIYIPAAFFPAAVHRFRTFVVKRISPSLFSELLSLGPSAAADRLLFPVFADFCLQHFPDEIKSYRLLVQSADLTAPHTWFPFARAMKRKIIYHCGPTNSGKTFNALQRFMAAGKAVYCSPLRLLAMEVFDKVNAMGVYCSLLTGQEHKLVPFAKHTACTVEMVSTDELFEVAVVDEIQMMADPTRGCAWTRALLGLKADEIHLCGDPSVLGLVRKICAETGDELIEQRYERFKPLVVEAKTLEGDLKKVKSGDCVVAFSRREIFEVKLAVEKLTGHRCCVIYGALPPETRRQQAALFNEEGNEYDVLVASDAVGMGLNLNIRRVVFYSLSKYDGDRVVPVPASQVKQIAGRAGRRGSRYPDGLVTTFSSGDLPYLVECLRRPFEEAKQAGLFPFFEQVELFAGQFPDLPFSHLLDKFRRSCRLDGAYFLSRHDHVRKVANLLEKVGGLSLADRFNFCFAPVNTRDPKVMHHLVRFAMNYSEKRPVGIALGMPRASARSDAELLEMEAKHQVVSVYLWLSHHFKEETFPQAEKAQEMASGIADLLGQSLARACWKPEPPRRKRSDPGGGGGGGAAADFFPEDEFDDEYQRPRSLAGLFHRRRQEGRPPPAASSSAKVAA